MLTCKEFDGFMIDYLEDGLPVWQKYMCWLHVKLCRECAYFIQQYRQVVALGRETCESPDETAPDAVAEELIQAALAHRKAK